jgi:hypothetical protein
MVGINSGDSRMNVHRALNHRAWRVGAHDVEDRMNMNSVQPVGVRPVVG